MELIKINTQKVQNPGVSYFFRQDHGYKDGSYIKVWHGEEDNEVLANLVNSLDANADDFQQQLYSALEAKYPKQ